MNTHFGHNETTVRLGLLAEDARRGLARVAAGEADAIEGWLAYGAALNEGRALFPGDREFGEWLRSSNLEEGIHPAEQSAAMWAAANPEQLEEARAAGNARTVRGIHVKWGEINAEREAAARAAEAEAARAAAAKAKAEAEARARAEAEAKRAAQEAADAKARAQAEARAKAEAESRAAAEQAEKEAEAAAKNADKKAASAKKKADAVKKKAGKGEASGGTSHVSHNSGNNEWYTPPAFIDAARRVMGGIDLDPATSEIANRTVQAARIFTAEDDGLAQEWPVGRIWMNPPYATPLIGQFAERLAQEVMRGSEAIVLVNNATETGWFQRMGEVCAAVCFPKARVRFLDPQGNPGAPLQGQAVIYCGPNADAFAAEFAAFGMVLRHG